MIAGWMLYSLAVALLAAVAAGLGERVAGGRVPFTRAFWFGGLCLALLFTASVLRPAGVMGGAAAGAAVVAAPEPLRSLVPADRVVPQGNRAGADRVLLRAWGAMSLTAILLLVGSSLRLRLRRRAWEQSWIDGQPVRLTDELGPAVVGLLRSEIIVPRWLLQRSVRERRLILEHERQHVQAGDPQLLFAALLLAALLPWNPGVWLLVRGLRRSTEMDCDRRVLRACGSPRVYAALLVEMGARPVSRVLAGTALVDFGSDLERRVAAILGMSRPLSVPAAGARLFSAGALLALAWLGPHPVVSLPSLRSAPLVLTRAGPGAAAGSLSAVQLNPGSRGRARGSAAVVTGSVARAASLRRLLLRPTPQQGARAGVAVQWTDASGHSHVINTDTLAALIAQQQGTLAPDFADADSVMFAFVFDDEARVRYTTVVRPASPDGRAVQATLQQLFPDLDGQRWLGGGWISRRVPSSGARARSVSTVFGIFGAESRD
jgi:hypothetical protein